jgi:hypothetical protein
MYGPVPAAQDNPVPTVQDNPVPTAMATAQDNPVPTAMAAAQDIATALAAPVKRHLLVHSPESRIFTLATEQTAKDRMVAHSCGMHFYGPMPPPAPPPVALMRAQKVLLRSRDPKPPSHPPTSKD